MESILALHEFQTAPTVAEGQYVPLPLDPIEPSEKEEQERFDRWERSLKRAGFEGGK